MQRDPAIDHAGRLTGFLTKAIGDFKSKPQGQQPMPVIPAITIAPKKDELVPSLTGALTLADQLTRRIEKAKARHQAANEKVDQAFGKLDGASDALEGLADRAEAEADAVLAKLGQVSNLGS